MGELSWWTYPLNAKALHSLSKVFRIENNVWNRKPGEKQNESTTASGPAQLKALGAVERPHPRPAGQAKTWRKQ